MHYHIGAYKRDRLVNADGYTRSREWAEDRREQAAYADVVAMEAHYEAADNMRGLVIDDISDPDYTESLRTIEFPSYDYRVIACNIAPGRCLATYEAIAQRRRARGQ